MSCHDVIGWPFVDRELAVTARIHPPGPNQWIVTKECDKLVRFYMGEERVGYIWYTPIRTVIKPQRSFDWIKPLEHSLYGHSLNSSW